MKAKPFESIRRKDGNGVIVRMFDLTQIHDKKWDKFADGKQYLVVEYVDTNEQYIPDNTKDFFTSTVLTEFKDVNKLLPIPKKKNAFAQARDKIEACKPKIFNSDSFNKAQNTYIKWCKDDAKQTVQKLEAGKVNNDD